MPSKFKSRTPWKEKLEKEQQPRIVEVPPKMQKAWGSGTMLIATPLLVDAEVRKVKKGKLTTVGQIMGSLARQFKADCTCPMTTGIFLRIVAEAAEEDRADGKKQITPYWRVLKSDGSLNEKYPGGAKAQAAKLRSEGHTIESAKGKKAPKVKDFEKHLVNS
jgi:alkylated DNA nucleotide flippase Atl1